MATKKRRCKHGRSKTTGKCLKAPRKGRKGGRSGGDRWSKMEAEFDKKSPGWRNYGEPQSFYNKLGSLGRMRRSRRSRR